MNYFEKRKINELLHFKCHNSIMVLGQSNKEVNDYLLNKFMKIFSKEKFTKNDISLANLLIKSLDSFYINTLFDKIYEENGLNKKLLLLFNKEMFNFNSNNRKVFLHKFVLNCDTKEDLNILYVLYYDMDLDRKEKLEIKQTYKYLISRKSHMINYELQKDNPILKINDLKYIVLSNSNPEFLYNMFKMELFDNKEILYKLFDLSKNDNYAWCYFILAILNYEPDLVKKIGVDKFKAHIKEKKLDDVLAGNLFKHVFYENTEKSLNNSKVLAQK